ncbi:MAG: DUF4178 domain-containing protein [Acidobacteriota bacterium]
MTFASCPSCGAQVEFAIGSSEVVICGTCRSIVARTDRRIEDHGKVAALVDTGSPLQVGTTGRFRGQGFRISGRTQLRHQAGGIWDEWYAALDDGRWAWLAEAQGRFYVTFKVAGDAPAIDTIAPGERILDDLTVAEIGAAELLSGEGELPWTPEAGSVYRYADLTGPHNRFATIDYSEEPPLLFKGEETTLAELGISGEAARPGRAALITLNCSQCGGALELRAPDQAERIWCPYCGAGHDITNGKLQFFAKLKKARVQPVIRLGSTGKIAGQLYVVAGFLQRAVRFDRDYFWTEYLLYNRAEGYRWLVQSDDHWSFVTPLRPGEVLDGDPRGAARTVSYDGHSYRIFQQATARVTYVMGEFYWKVAVGEQADTADYVRAPFGISKELTRSGAKEIAYSHARYAQSREIEEAFNIQNLTRPAGVGPIQPFTGAKLGGTWAIMLALLLATAIFVGVTRSRRDVLSQTYDLSTATRPEGAPENARVLFSEPFELSGEKNFEVRAESALSNTWLYLGMDLVDDASGQLQSFELPLEYYSGVDGGESWSEGSRSGRIVLSHPPKGRYVLRVEGQWEAGKPPPAVTLRAREGVFRISHFLLAFIAVSVFPGLALLRQISFESQRWKDSSFTPFGQLNADDDDDEE